MITAYNNPQIKLIKELLEKSKAREKNDLFVLEGARLCMEAPLSKVKSLYVSEDFYNKSFEDMLTKFGKDKKDYEDKVQVVDNNIFKSVSNTVTPQGIMAVCKRMYGDLNEVISKGKPVLVLENLQDPGNMGTILRTAEAAGMAGILASKGTVDIYNPKVVRATMGTIFRVPVVYEDIDTIIDKLKKNDFVVMATILDEDSKSLYDYKFGLKSAVVIGNEGNGITKETSEKCTSSCYIPMSGEVESLNASVAAAVMMYEIKRQVGI